MPNGFEFSEVKDSSSLIKASDVFSKPDPNKARCYHQYPDFLLCSIATITASNGRITFNSHNYSAYSAQGGNIAFTNGWYCKQSKESSWEPGPDRSMVWACFDSKKIKGCYSYNGGANPTGGYPYLGISDSKELCQWNGSAHEAHPSQYGVGHYIYPTARYLSDSFPLNSSKFLDVRSVNFSAPYAYTLCEGHQNGSTSAYIDFVFYF